MAEQADEVVQILSVLSGVSRELQRLTHASLLAAKAISAGRNDKVQTLIRTEIDKLLKELEHERPVRSGISADT